MFLWNGPYFSKALTWYFVTKIVLWEEKKNPVIEEKLVKFEAKGLDLQKFWDH